MAQNRSSRWPMRDDRVCGFAKAPSREAAPSHSRDSHRQLDQAGTIAFARTSRPTPYVSSSAASDISLERLGSRIIRAVRSSAARGACHDRFAARASRVDVGHRRSLLRAC